MSDKELSFSLANKRVLVTGAVGYLGSEMARAATQAGAHVFVNSRSADKAHKLCAELGALGGQAEAAVFDVCDAEATSRWFESRNEPLHVLVNNAYAGGAGSLNDATDVQYSESYEVSVIAAQRLVKLAMPHLLRAREQSNDASVINIATMYGIVAPDPANYATRAEINPPFYGAAKAALLQWTRHAAVELGEAGIRVNSISPGPFPNPDVQRQKPQLIEKLASKTPLGRIGNSPEIAGPFLFLASSASSYVTGANLVVDGGWTSW